MLQVQHYLFVTFTFQYGATSTYQNAKVSINSAKFTFQYGATSTSTSASIMRQIPLFTFQYGATSTDIDDRLIVRFKDLHSNMVLLLLLS